MRLISAFTHCICIASCMCCKNHDLEAQDVNQNQKARVASVHQSFSSEDEFDEVKESLDKIYGRNLDNN